MDANLNHKVYHQGPVPYPVDFFPSAGWEARNLNQPLLIKQENGCPIFDVRRGGRLRWGSTVPNTPSKPAP
jgi:hypothetical protein